jgi:hypothetical protein
MNDSMRDDLIARATELQVFDAPAERTNNELYWPIKAEENAAAWLTRMESLPTDAAKRDAVHRLRVQMEQQS